MTGRDREPVGALAVSLFAAEAAFLAAERRVEGLLDALYDSWSDFEIGDYAIDVYDVLPSDAAVAALFRSGFHVVREHPHARHQFRHCACRSRRGGLL